MKTLLFLLLSTGALGAVPANQAFEKADLPACLSGADWTAREVRASLVVFAEGGWSLAIDHHDLPPGLIRPMRECLHAAVRAAMEEAAPPRKTSVLTRLVKGPLPPAGVGTLVRPDGSAVDELGQVTALLRCPEKREALEAGTSCSAKGPQVCSFPNGSWCACEWSECVTPAGPIPGCKPASGWVCRDDGCPREPRGACSTEGKVCQYDHGMCVNPNQCRGGKWQAGPPMCRPAAPPAPSP